MGGITEIWRGLGKSSQSIQQKRRDTLGGTALGLVLCLCVSFLLSVAWYPQILCAKEDSVETAQKQGITAIQLTQEEQEFLREHPTITVAVDRSWMPIGYEQGGEYKGIMANILAKISNRSGIAFTYVFADTYVEAVDMMKNGQADAIAGFAEDEDSAEEAAIHLSESYLHIDYSALTRSDLSDFYKDYNEHSRAVVRGDYANHITEEQEAGTDIVYCDSNDETIKAVKRGEVDIAIIASYCAEYYASMPKYRNLTLYPIDAYGWNLCMGIHQDCDQRVLSIINRSIESLTEADISTAVYGAMLDASAQTDWSYYLYMHPVPFGIAVAMVVLFLIYVVYQTWQMTSRVKKQRERNMDEIRYAIDRAGLSVFEYDFKTKKITNLSDKVVIDDQSIYVQNLPDSLIESDLVHEDDKATMRDMYRRLVSGENQVTGRWRIRRTEQNKYEWKQSTFYVIRDEKQNPASALGVNKDVTEEVKSQEYTSRVEQFQTALQKGTIASYELDLNEILDGHISQEEYKMFQKELAEPVLTEHRQRYLKFMDPDRLRAQYEVGITKEVQQFQFMKDNLELIWGNAEVKLIQDSSSQHLICYHTIEDIDEKKRMELYLKEKAERDGLTSLYNRHTFRDMTEQLLAECNIKSMGCAFFMIDLDNFKEINDTYGHEIGDQVLKNVSGELLATFRTYDVIGRLGGDEFTVLMTHIKRTEDASHKAEALCAAVRRIHLRMEWPFEVSCSVGVAMVQEHISGFDELYKKADEALYEAKKKGKNQFYMAE